MSKIVALMALLVTAALGQTIRTGTRLVQLSVIASDSKGRPIENLTKDDFAIEDAGHRRDIAVFSRHAAAEAPIASAQLMSNRPVADDRNIVIILFDELNTSTPDRARVRKQLLEALPRLSGNPNVALYVLGNNLRVLYDFAKPGNAANALARHQISAEFVSSRFDLESRINANANVEAALTEAEQNLADAKDTYRALATLEALRAIASHVTGIRGRKTLVWITGGFPFTIGFDGASTTSARPGERHFGDEALAAARTLNDADVSVSVIDARGLQANSFRSTTNPMQRTRQSSIDTDTSQQTMATIAVDTGGELFRNTNDFGHSIERVLDESAETYTVGFYVSDDQLDDKYHPLKLTTRQKGVHLRYRKGYFAYSDPLPVPHASEPLVSLLRSASPFKDVYLRIELQPVAENKLKVIAHVGPDGLSFQQENDKWNGGLEWYAASGRGGVYQGKARPYRISYTPAVYADFAAHGVTLTEVVTVAPEDDEIGIAVRDATSKLCGTLRLYRRRPAEDTPRMK